MQSSMQQTVAVSRQREAIGGWLLLICILLVPHILNSALILAKSPGFVIEGGVDVDPAETLRIVTLIVMFLGHSSGLLLILNRHRFAPAFFTIYVPLLFVLFLLDPDPSLTVRSYAQRVGVNYPEGPGPFAVHVIVSFASSAVFLGYWLRSERVRRTFGSNGVEIFRDRARTP